MLPIICRPNKPGSVCLHRDPSIIDTCICYQPATSNLSLYTAEVLYSVVCKCIVFIKKNSGCRKSLKRGYTVSESLALYLFTLISRGQTKVAPQSGQQCFELDTFSEVKLHNGREYYDVFL